MAEFTSASSPAAAAPAIDWADDTDDEIDFGAPVFSDDDELASELAKMQADSNYGASKPASPPRARATSSSYTTSSSSASPLPRYTAGFNDGSNRSLDRRSQNDSSLQTMSSRSSRGRDYPPSYRDSPDSYQHHSSSFSSPRGSTPVDRDRDSRFKPGSRLGGGVGDGRGSSFGSPQSDSSARWTRNNDDRVVGAGSGAGAGTGGQRPARQVIPLPPKPSVTPDRPQVDRSRSPSFRSRSPLPGSDRPRDRPIQQSSSSSSQPQPHPQQQQRMQSPYMDQGRSLSPSSAHHQYHGLSTRSFSPGRQQPRTHMDQVIRSNEQQSKRRSRDIMPPASEGRWEKTPHEDKPYPALPPPAPAHVATSPSPKDKDDTVYFLRREGRNNNSSNANSGSNNVQQSEALWTSDLRKNAGIMHHEKEKLSTNNNSRGHGPNGSNDRWDKATLQEPDLPYPERSSPSSRHNNNSNHHNQHHHDHSNNNNNGNAKHSRTQSRSGQADGFPHVSPSPPVEKTSARGTRGKGKDQKRRSKDPSLNGGAAAGAGDDDSMHDDSKDGGSEVPWWEQSTYGAKKKEEPKESPKPAA
ncbi:hypothetical protein BGZ95_002070, partial [Linnemannia exigua]